MAASSSALDAENVRSKAEARRRKILANAEKRMRFVTGRSTTLETENGKKEETGKESSVYQLDSRTQKEIVKTLPVEHTIREDKGAELERKFQDLDARSSDTLTPSDFATQSDHRESHDSAVEASDEKQTKSSDAYLLSPLLRAVTVFLVGLSYHLAQEHPDMLRAMWISPSWLGHSILFGLLSVYIPTIILLSTRFGRCIGVRVSKKIDIAASIVVYLSSFIGIPVSVGRWLMWICLVAYDGFVDLAVTLMFFFLLFMNDN